MLLNNTYNDSIPYQPTSAASTDLESIIDDVAKEMAFSEIVRRQFRDSCSPSASYGQKNGAVSRITKPASAGNSPRRVGRRKSMLPESTSRTRSTLYNHFENMFNLTSSKDRLPQEAVATRPVSWQPTSRQGHWAPLHQAHDTSLLEMLTDYRFSTGSFGLTYLGEPEMSSLLPYSNPVSPHSPILPSDDPFQLYDQQVYGLTDTCYTQEAEYLHSDIQYPPQILPSPLPVQGTQMTPDGPSDQYLLLANSQQDWSQFVYGSGAFFPPTPPQPQSHTPFPVQPLTPSAQTEADPPSQPNFELQGGTKELVGMGLYDAPDSSTPALEPDDYRNSFISTLSYLDQDCPGKGLKLEETWKPAESDDDDDDDDEESSSIDDSQDGPRDTVGHQEDGLSNAMVDNSMILPPDGLFDEETYLATSAFLTQSKTQGVGFDGLSWI
ncbi:hypothetical protein FGG08_000267 [Glutinoglossum americanum]|uniref:Uncharacterized protein n=1 Tax=Glutinoglossum americanum TaxID=1670608 RepID=A0A9P8IIB9_9PEZI|nr:hypothetical protein FGG08_000267 [Glutinoglossum americanum]